MMFYRFYINKIRVSNVKGVGGMLDLIKGIYETHLDVEDLETAIDFYENKLGLKVGHKGTDRRYAFFYLYEGTPQEYMIGLWEKEVVHPSHFAFRVDPKDMDQIIPRLIERGIEIRPAWGYPPVEPVVHPHQPAAAVYFNDLDGNSLEFHCLLEGPKRLDLGVMPYSEWIKTVKEEVK